MMWSALLAWLTLFMTRTCGDTPPPALAPACSLIPTTSTGLMAEQGLVESLSARRLLGPPTTLTAPTLSSWPPALHALARLSAKKNVFLHCYTNRETVLSLKNVLWLRDNLTHQSIDKRPVRSGSFKSCDIPCLHLQNQVNYL